MNILALDASSNLLSYSVVKNNQLIYEYNRIVEKSASFFVQKLAKTLKKISMGVEDFDFFVIGSGPGSFTGLRVSFSIIKAFAFAAKKPVFSQSSFLACAYPFRKKEEKIAVISDAKKNLVYAAFFSSNKKGIKEKAKPKLCKLEDCVKRGRGHLFLTYDSHLRQKAIKIKKNIRFYQKDVYPRAKYLLETVDCNQRIDDLRKLKPLYLHPMDCQIRRRSQKI